MSNFSARTDIRALRENYSRQDINWAIRKLTASNIVIRDIEEAATIILEYCEGYNTQDILDIPNLIIRDDDESAD